MQQRGTVLWAQVFGIGGLQAAIALTWVVYDFYLPQLMKQAGFPAAMTVGLLTLEKFLSVVVEPVSGWFSDRARRWIGSRFPFIALGVIVSAALLIAIPATMVIGNSQSVLKWLMPTVAVIWALAMTTFRGPMFSLLNQYSGAESLPYAMSVVVLMGALANSLGMFANKLILGLGPWAAFGIGSIALLLAVMVVRKMNPDVHVNYLAKPSSHSTSRLSKRRAGIIMLLGAAVGLGTFLMRRSINNVTGDLGPMLLTSFTISHLITLLPGGWVATQFGNRRTMMVGIAGILVGLMGLCLTLPSIVSVPFVILLASGFSLVANGSFPFVLGLVSEAQSALAVSLYFSGSNLAGSILSSQLDPRKIPPQTGWGFSALLFAIAGLCIFLSTRLPRRL